MGRLDVAHRENQPHRGAFAQFTVNLDSSFVPFHDAIDHRQTEAGATLAFGGKERFEATLACLLVHANAGVHDFQNGVAGSASARSGKIPASDPRSYGDDSAVG